MRGWVIELRHEPLSYWHRGNVELNPLISTQSQPMPNPKSNEKSKQREKHGAVSYSM